MEDILKGIEEHFPQIMGEDFSMARDFLELKYGRRIPWSHMVYAASRMGIWRIR